MTRDRIHKNNNKAIGIVGRATRLDEAVAEGDWTVTEDSGRKFYARHMFTCIHVPHDSRAIHDIYMYYMHSHMSYNRKHVQEHSHNPYDCYHTADRNRVAAKEAAVSPKETHVSTTLQKPDNSKKTRCLHRHILTCQKTVGCFQ